MSNTRMARGPLLIAVVFGLIAVAAFALPMLGVSVIPTDLQPLVAAGAGAIAVIALVLSLISGRKGGDDDMDEEEAQIPEALLRDHDEDDLLTADPAAAKKLSRKEKAEAKAAEKAAKKEEAERAKFEKQAQKEAEKAAKKAAKGKGKGKDDAQETSDWLAEIKQQPTDVEDNMLGPTAAFGAAAATPLATDDFYTQPLQTEDDYYAAPVVEEAVVEYDYAALSQDDYYAAPVVEEAVAEYDYAAPVVEEAADEYDFAAPAQDPSWGEAALIEQPVDFSALSSPTDAPMYDMATPVPLPVPASDAPADDTPDWAQAPMEDFGFAVPFQDEIPAEDLTEEIPVITEEAVIDEYANPMEDNGDDIVAEEILVVEEFANDDPSDLVAEEVVLVDEYVASDDATEATEVYDVTESYDEGLPADVDVVFPEDDVVEEPAEEFTASTPEERLMALAENMQALAAAAAAEVAAIRGREDEIRNEYQDQVTHLSESLAMTRSEMSTMAEELSAASEAQIAALDAQAALAQAEIAASRAHLERQQAVSRLRQVRIAILSKDPVDHDLLAVVDKSLADMNADEAPHQEG